MSTTDDQIRRFIAICADGEHPNTALAKAGLAEDFEDGWELVNMWSIRAAIAHARISRGACSLKEEVIVALDTAVRRLASQDHKGMQLVIDNLQERLMQNYFSKIT